METSTTSSVRAKSRPVSDRRKVRIIAKIRDFHKDDIESSDTSTSPWISVQKSTEESSANNVKILLRDQASSCKEYMLDYCYEHHEDIPQIFSKEVKPLLLGVFHGVNTSVIAYGARGSGKTYLIQGSTEKPGLATLAMDEILSRCEVIGGSVKISYYEVYHDHVYDLLNPKEQEVSVWEDNGGQVQLKGISKVQVQSISEFKTLYFQGSNPRKPAQKFLNNVRRSHKALIIYVSSIDNDANYPVVGKLNFVDLAGYEDIKRMSTDIIPHAESPRINKSLYAIENVVRALNANERHVPFRDTKLTRILQDSIGGASQALVVTCLNPTFCQDTVHVISWAARAFQAAKLTCHDSIKKVKCKTRLLGLSSPPSACTPQVHTTSKKKTTNLHCGMKERNSLHVLKSVQESSISNVVEAVKSPEEKYIEGSNNAFELLMPKQDSSSEDHKTMKTPDKGSKVESFQDVDRSPPISAKLREITNSLKALCRAAPLSIKTPNTDSIKYSHISKDSSENLTPLVPINMRANEYWEAAKSGTPGETFKTRSCGLKETLVQEYLRFLNSASKEELKELKGIGEKRAHYILEVRENSQEPFKDLDDLKDIGLSTKQIKGMMRQVAGQLFN